MDGVPVQQQSKRHPGWWNGSRQNHPDYCSYHLPDGAQEAQRSLSHHCSSLVSTPDLPSIIALFVQCYDILKHFLWRINERIVKKKLLLGTVWSKYTDHISVNNKIGHIVHRGVRSPFPYWDSCIYLLQVSSVQLDLPTGSVESRLTANSVYKTAVSFFSTPDSLVLYFIIQFV